MLRTTFDLHSSGPALTSCDSVFSPLALRFSILSALILIPLLHGDVRASQQLGILLGKAIPHALITGRGLHVIAGDGWTHPVGDRVTVEAVGVNRFKLNRWDKSVPGPLRIAAQSGLLEWKRNRFRGALELVSPGAGRMDIINLIGIEDYLCGIVNAEIFSDWPMEAVKAQVVAARTYAFRKKIGSDKPYDLVATTGDQVYGGASAEDARAVRAVRETRGWVITHRGEPIVAYYHSCCGGHTDSAANIKGVDLPYLKGVACPWCKNSPSFSWDFHVSARRLAQLLSGTRRRITEVDSILTIKKTPSGRIVDLEVTSPENTLFLSGEDLRRIVGYRNLRSARFEVARKGQIFLFRGTGYGHGIGACQWGMKGLAEKGHTWRQILRYYYQGVEFSRIK